MADFDDDPVYRDTWREMRVILTAWALCMVWSVTYCYLNGYARHDRIPGEITALMPPMEDRDRSPESLTTPFGLGIPDWALWGVTVPWVLCIGFSAWFCFWLMRDDPEQIDRGEDQHMVNPAGEGGADHHGS